MTASKIMVIRHSEKPNDRSMGVAIDGRENKDSLTVQGWQRAGALAMFFTSANAGLATKKVAVPDVIIASDDRKHGSSGAPEPADSDAKEGSHSKRPIETVTPLADRLKIRLTSSDYWPGDEEALVKGAVACSGNVLICWQHENIPKIANLLMPPPDPVPNDWPVPQKWPRDRFDVVWVFDPVGDGGWTFSETPQNLLAGDIDAPIDPHAKDVQS